MLLRLELVVVNQGDDPLPVHYVSLSPSQSAEEISWHTECLPYFVAFIAEKRVREVVLCLESLVRLRRVSANSDNGRTKLPVVLIGVSEGASLFRTARSLVGRIEVQNQRSAPELGELDLATVLVFQR